MKKITSIALCSFLSITILSGCGAYSEKHRSTPEKGYGTRENIGNPQYAQTKSYGHTPGQKPDHQNQRFEMNKGIANEISALAGIRHSIVALTDKNAYVAIVIDNSAHGTKAHGGIQETDNTGLSDGVYDNIRNQSSAPYQQLVTGVNSYETIQDEQDISSRLKQMIGNRVRLLSPHVLNVYISAERNFINQMSIYEREAWKGNSLEPHYQQFNSMVRNLFK